MAERFEKRQRERAMMPSGDGRGGGRGGDGRRGRGGGRRDKEWI